MKRIILTATVAALTACGHLFGASSIQFERGPLTVWVSSDDLSHLDIQGSTFLLVSCRTTRADTASFSIELSYLVDGKVARQGARLPRLPDNLLLPPTGLGLIANTPWTVFRFTLPAGATLSNIAIEEILEPAVFTIPAN